MWCGDRNQQDMSIKIDTTSLTGNKPISRLNTGHTSRQTVRKHNFPYGQKINPSSPKKMLGFTS